MHGLLEEIKAVQQGVVKKLTMIKIFGIYPEGNEKSLRQMCDKITFGLRRILLAAGWGMYWSGQDCGNDLGQGWAI